MGFTNRERTDALALYLGLGLEVFPYDTRAVAFIGWNNPALYGDHYRDLAGRTHTFGVRLDEWTAVVDVDADDGGDLERLELDVGPLPPTFTVVSPGGEGNLHLMFRTSVPLRTCRALKAFHPGIDFLSAGSHVKGASSVRYLETNEEVMYKFQRPILDPAPLPAALEARWAKMMPATRRRPVPGAGRRGAGGVDTAEAHAQSEPQRREQDREGAGQDRPTIGRRPASNRCSTPAETSTDARCCSAARSTSTTAR